MCDPTEQMPEGITVDLTTGARQPLIRLPPHPDVIYPQLEKIIRNGVIEHDDDEWG